MVLNFERMSKNWTVAAEFVSGGIGNSTGSIEIGRQPPSKSCS
jgi:hypothetical protein